MQNGLKHIEYRTRKHKVFLRNVLKYFDGSTMVYWRSFSYKHQGLILAHCSNCARWFDLTSSQPRYKGVTYKAGVIQIAGATGRAAWMVLWLLWVYKSQNEAKSFQLWTWPHFHVVHPITKHPQTPTHSPRTHIYAYEYLYIYIQCVPEKTKPRSIDILS